MSPFKAASRARAKYRSWFLWPFPDDRSIIAILVGAIKDLASKVADLATTVASFAEKFTTKELTFDRAYGHELTVDKLCVGAVCVTEGQFMSVFGASALSQSASAAAILPANDNEQEPAEEIQATTTAATVDPEEPPPSEVAPEVAPPVSAVEALPEAANDNSISEPLPATGTE